MYERRFTCQGFPRGKGWGGDKDREMTVALPAEDNGRPLSGITSGPGLCHQEKLGERGDTVSRVSPPPCPPQQALLWVSWSLKWLLSNYVERWALANLIVSKALEEFESELLKCLRRGEIVMWEV